MAEYQDLGPSQGGQPVKAGSGDVNNPYGAGFYTVTLTPQILNSKVAQAEMYHANIDGPVGSSFQVYRNRQRWDVVLQGWLNSYDPEQPMYVRDGDTIFFYWNFAPPATPVPSAVVWLRYDTALRANRQPGLRP